MACGHEHALRRCCSVATDSGARLHGFEACPSRLLCASVSSFIQCACGNLLPRVVLSLNEILRVNTLKW